MTTTYGLTTTGLVIQPQSVISAAIASALQAAFGASIDTTSGSFFGQLIGILSEREGLLWQLMQQIAASQDPNQATGAALDALSALTGTYRTPATSSLVTLTLTGTPTTVVPVGSQAKTTSTGSLWATTVAGTITTVATWIASTVYAIGARVTLGSKIYQCTINGTSASSGGPSGTGSAIVDGTVTWMFLGGGTGAIDVAAASVITGVIVGAGSDINLIQTPVGGWTNVLNVLSAVAGSPVMTDAALRILRAAELSAAGVATPNAIRAAILKVAGVTSATVFVNNTDVVNSDSMPPHSVECLVQGGTTATIAACLFASVAAGIALQGTTTTTVIDSQGTTQTVKYTVPANIVIYDDVTLTYDATMYPANGDAQVQAAIVAYGQAQATGNDVVASAIVGCLIPIYANGTLVSGVAGVLDVSLVKIGLAPSPTTSTTIVISSRQLAVHSTGNITVHSSAGSR